MCAGSFLVGGAAMKNNMHGVGLVELMISLLLGSILMAAMLELLLTQRQLAQQIEASASLTERIHFAADFISRHVMEAGYAPLQSEAPYPIGTAGFLASTDGRLADTLVILSEGGQGCTDDVLENDAGVEWRKFSVHSEKGRRELRCEDSEGGPYPMLEGVEGFQVQYGVDSNQDRAPDFYTNATQLPENAALVSVRVGLLLRGETVIGADANTPATDRPLLDAMLSNDPRRGIDFKDGYLRRLFVVTVALRNLQS